MQNYHRLALLVCALLFASSARAEESSVALEAGQPRPGYDHRGLFMRAAIGYGYLGLTASGRGDAAEIRGDALLWNFAIGASLRERLALHAVYFGSAALDPTMTISLEGGYEDEYESMVSGSTHNFGTGLTYYTPSNWYFGAQLGIAFISHSTLSNNNSMASRPGFAAGLLLGKEWFVTSNFGIGLAGQFDFVHASDEGGTLAWTGVSGGPLLSLTFN